MVAVGGGHGLARALSALRLLDVEPVAVVTVADDGGSSGRLRRDLGIIALGDLRMALLTLARNDRLATVLAHRFARGELEGHALGNLLLLATAEQHDGDIVAALEAAGGLLDCAGRVLPSTSEPVQLNASVAGTRVDGQARVATADGTVERVWLEPRDPPAPPETLAAIRDADVVLLGPGSLFTSVIATILVPQIAKEIAAAQGRVVYLGNVATEPGETSGLDVKAHIAALLDHLPGVRLDAAVLHDGPPARGGAPLGTTVADERAGRIVRADLVARRRDGSAGYGHDPWRLADALAGLVRQPGPRIRGPG